jgi:hypothetical protein
VKGTETGVETKINLVVTYLHSDSSALGVDQGAVTTAKLEHSKIQHLCHVDNSRGMINRDYVRLSLAHKMISGRLMLGLPGLAHLQYLAMIDSPPIAERSRQVHSHAGGQTHRRPLPPLLLNFELAQARKGQGQLALVVRRQLMVHLHPTVHPNHLRACPRRNQPLQSRHLVHEVTIRLWPESPVPALSVMLRRCGRNR